MTTEQLANLKPGNLIAWHFNDPQETPALVGTVLKMNEDVLTINWGDRKIRSYRWPLSNLDSAPMELLTT